MVGNVVTASMHASTTITTPCCTLDPKSNMLKKILQANTTLRFSYLLQNELKA
jgi:hypothetical protein